MQQRGLCAILNSRKRRLRPACCTNPLIQDCDRLIGEFETPAVRVMRKVLALCLRELSRRPDLALQTLYNRLTWIGKSGHSWQQTLRAAENRLNSQSMWLRAEGPLPGSEKRGSFSMGNRLGSFCCNQKA